MGIFKQDSYGVTCDGCGETHEDSFIGYVIWGDQSQATDSANEDGWQEINGKWYCPNCRDKLFHYDEELDEYVLNNKED